MKSQKLLERKRLKNTCSKLLITFSKIKVMRLNWELWNICLILCTSLVMKSVNHWLEYFRSSKKIKRNGESENVSDNNSIEFYKSTNQKLFSSMFCQFYSNSVLIMYQSLENKQPKRLVHSMKNSELKKAWSLVS